MPSVSRRQILRKAGLAGSLITIPAIAGAVVSNRAEAAVCSLSINPDPTFALIEAHRQADALVNPLDIDDDEPAFDAACDAETAAFKALLLTAPTTLPGLAAYVEYVDDPELWLYQDPDEIDPETNDPTTYSRIALRTIPASLRMIGGAL